MFTDRSQTEPEQATRTGSNERASAARDVLATADSFAYLLDLDDDEQTRSTHEMPLLETFRTLNGCTVLARDLRRLADEFEKTGAAHREQLGAAISRHDEQQHTTLRGRDEPTRAF